MHVPYITTWSAERPLPATVIERAWSGIGYADETVNDRDQNGVLWQRMPFCPGRGRPEFGRVHPLRQRRAMLKLLCGICGGPPDRTEQGVLWLIADYRDDWPGWPDGMAATEPPVCLSCARLSVRVCPALRTGHVTVRVGHSAVAGVYGARFRVAQPLPVATQEAVVAFDDPAIRWTQATQLVRELSECTIVSL